jgi:hypothetical protein
MAFCTNSCWSYSGRSFTAACLFYAACMLLSCHCDGTAHPMLRQCRRADYAENNYSMGPTRQPWTQLPVIIVMVNVTASFIIRSSFFIWPDKVPQDEGEVGFCQRDQASLERRSNNNGAKLIDLGFFSIFGYCYLVFRSW